MKKKYCIILFTVVLAVFGIWYLMFTEKKLECGTFKVRVYDAYTQEPLKNAKVVIPEVNKQLYTNEKGETETIELPILYDEHYNKLLKQDYGRITVLVYCDGYVPYGLFFAHVYPNKLHAPNVWLFEDNGAKPFVIIESPDDTWAQDMIKKYR